MILWTNCISPDPRDWNIMHDNICIIQTQKGLYISCYYEPTLYLQAQGLKYRDIMDQLYISRSMHWNIIILWSNWICPGWGLKHHDIMIQLNISRPTQELKYHNAVNQLYITSQFKVLKYHDNMNYLNISRPKHWNIMLLCQYSYGCFKH